MGIKTVWVVTVYLRGNDTRYDMRSFKRKKDAMLCVINCMRETKYGKVEITTIDTRRMYPC